LPPLEWHPGGFFPEGDQADLTVSRPNGYDQRDPLLDEVLRDFVSHQHPVTNWLIEPQPVPLLQAAQAFRRRRAIGVLEGIVEQPSPPRYEQLAHRVQQKVVQYELEVERGAEQAARFVKRIQVEPLGSLHVSNALRHTGKAIYG